MVKVSVDKTKIAEILTRGVEKIYPGASELEKKLLSGDRIRLYCGFDPTAPALHIGNAITLNKLAQFQALGHEVICLIGDFTAMIGDPTDKKAARKKMTRAEVLANAADYKRQIAAYLDFTGENPAQLLYNSDWNDKLSFSDLIELSSHFTVQQMIQRDMFQERLKDKKPIYLHEFLYPLAQANDSLFLDVDLELGGNDQMFNMMCGRTLLKAVKNKEKFVLTLKLLTDESGKKMGKSEGNIVFLSETPNNMYGQVMSWPDGALNSGFELCTNLSLAEIAQISADLKKGTLNPRDLKMKLAKEITKINYGEKAAQEAEDNFIKTIQKKELPADDKLEQYTVGLVRKTLVDLLVETKLVKSKTEARQKISEGAIKIKIERKSKNFNEEMQVIKDLKYELDFNNDVVSVVIQKGKFNFVRVVI